MYIKTKDGEVIKVNWIQCIEIKVLYLTTDNIRGWISINDISTITQNNPDA